MVDTFALDGYWFEWQGGQYIDVHIDGEPVPFDCINIVGQDNKRTVKTKAQFVARCIRYVKDLQK